MHQLNICTLIKSLYICLLHALQKWVLPSCHSSRHWPVETGLTSFSVGPAHKMLLNIKQNFWLYIYRFFITNLFYLQ